MRTPISAPQKSLKTLLLHLFTFLAAVRLLSAMIMDIIPMMGW
jgi:hypothetical protein